MKKITLLLAACAFTTAAFAQTPETEVKVRDNGTKKVVTTTGKTNVGQALENTADAAGNVAKKAGHSIKRGAKKAKRSVKRTSQKASTKAANKTAELENKSE